jgi:hypothetical protein
MPPVDSDKSTMHPSAGKRVPAMPAHGKGGSSREFESECVLFFAEVVQVLGVPKSVGQIYGLLYASPVPLSFSDLVEHLGISKGSASQGLQLLRALGAVKMVEAPAQYPRGGPSGGGAIGPRRDYYEPELGLRRLIGGILRGKVEPVVEQGKLRMQQLRKLAQATSDAGRREFQLERVEQLETWRRQVTIFLPVLKTLLASPRL